MICDKRNRNTDKWCYFLTGQYFCTLPNEFVCVRRGIMKPYLSQSQVSDWLRCRRLWAYKHLFRIKCKDNKLPNAIKQGILWDGVHNAFYTKGDIHKVRDDIIVQYEMNEYDIARVMAMFNAYLQLIDPVLEGCTVQLETTDDVIMSMNNGSCPVKGVIDRAYKRYFVESKLTSDKRYYDNVWSLTPQLGTYFILHPEFNEAIIEIAIKPQLRTKEDEAPEQFKKRIYDSVLSTPSKYFIGYDRKKRSYGIRFYATDFNLRELRDRYVAIWNEIKVIDGIENEKERLAYFYKCESGCFMYGSMCEYLPACKRDCLDDLSEEIFEYNKSETIDK